MEKMYRICDLNVLADLRHSMISARAYKYLCDAGAVDIIIPYDRDRIEALMEQGALSEDSAENILTADIFYTELLRFNGFMLHSSAVAVDGKAYLFSAPSGTGKSTHTSLWKRTFGERAVIINDDKPALRVIDGKVYAYGTPWSGKSDLNVNISVPVAGICVLERSAENYIHPLDEGEAVFSILNQTIRPRSEELMSVLLEHLDKVLCGVKVWKMGCNISDDAAIMAYEAMSGANEK